MVATRGWLTELALSPEVRERHSASIKVASNNKVNVGISLPTALLCCLPACSDVVRSPQDKSGSVLTTDTYDISKRHAPFGVTSCCRTGTCLRC